MIDHTVMEKLHEMEKDFAQQGRKFVVVGMDEHMPVSSHPYAARTKAVKPATNGQANGQTNGQTTPAAGSQEDAIKAGEPPVPSSEH